MKLKAFQIKNYRSIIDSGKCHLSHDDITALIGQNESGKTSVLEALKSFYEGQITDDVLRSDQTFPEITCVFELGDLRIDELLDMSLVPPELHESILKKKEVALVRRWIDSRKNTIGVAEYDILEYYESVSHMQVEADQKIIQQLSELTTQHDLAEKDTEASEKALIEIRNELNQLHNKQTEAKKMIAKTRKADQQVTSQYELETTGQQLVTTENRLNEMLGIHDEKKHRQQKIAEKLRICKEYGDSAGRFKILEQDLLNTNKSIQDAEHQFELCSSERERKVISKKLEQLKDEGVRITFNLQDCEKQVTNKRKMAMKLLENQEYAQAEEEARQELELEKTYYSIEKIGSQLFSRVPVFEFFEDFSSLLPNKIDLEDLLNENIHAEGYKAARNFLSVAGLNADFFREKNHRILKQKIENLNSEITIDFQDYWRQNVGKKDKIKLNFELEHYDYTVPEKSGKPYLEFWIKDKRERLYPKQRSRGVRWFLSFYLELRATAIQNHFNRVMLIDEPGLSLHARAQEDVLKVFEDLRNKLQIVYSTHSPHLIDVSKLYRVLAVQRANEEDEKSETVVLDTRSLHEASKDTLSPIYSLMGNKLNEQQLIYSRNNIIVEDTITFYYLDALTRLYVPGNELHFLPATGASNIPMLANILLGWKLDFCLLTFDNPEGKRAFEFIRKTIFVNREEDALKKLKCIEGFSGIEDMFSTIDFKRFILHQRVGITEANTAYIENNNLSRIMLAANFNASVQKDTIRFDDFDEESRRNLDGLIKLITALSDNQ